MAGQGAILIDPATANAPFLVDRRADQETEPVPYQRPMLYTRLRPCGRTCRPPATEDDIMAETIFILNGPNLNTLGLREPGIYGTSTLAQIERSCDAAARRCGLEAVFRQSNHEGVLIDWIHEAAGKAAAIVINPGAYGHTSIALHDALRFFAKPVVEVHLSNIHAREDFRHKSLIAPVAMGVICGLGAKGYELAIGFLADRLSARPNDSDQEG